ncbi:hypothetical protein Bbelb_397990 [Branchiostoma belcheri]|nr:hypothetical protein Bbelb_397990 [Branchiostoma belcheri]
MAAVHRYTTEFLRSCKLASGFLPLPSQTKDQLRQTGLLRVRSRPRGSKAGKNFIRQIKPVVGFRPQAERNSRHFTCKSLTCKYQTQPPSLSVYDDRISVLKQIRCKESLDVPQPRSTHPMPTILLSNARSLRNKLEEFQCVLNQNAIQIAIVSETWFTPEQPDEMFSIDSFTTFSKPRQNRTGGGVAVYVSDQIYARQLDIAVPPDLECTWVYVRQSRLPREVSGLVVCAVYLPPGSPHQDILNVHLIDTIDQLRTNTNMKQVVNIPTREDVTLDLITNLGRFYNPCSAIAPLGMSDHRSIVLLPGQQTKTNKSTRRTVRPMPDSRLRSFGAWITSHDWSEVTREEGSQAMTTALYNTLQVKISEHFPTRSIKIHSKDKPWVTPEIKNLISLRQRALNNGKTSAWKVVRNKLQAKIRSARQSFYSSKVQCLRKHDPANWHKDIKSMANLGRTNPVIHIDGIAPDNNKASADAINSSLSKIPQSLPPLDISLLSAFLPDLQSPQVKVSEMYDRLQKVRVRKAAGPDNITGRLIREFAYELSQPLTCILNASLSEGLVPREWREATVIPIPKTKPPSLEELRPVSLTSLLAKVCEGFVAKWTLVDIIQNIDPKQFGGLPGKSTTHCLVDILHHLSSTADRRGTLSSIVLTDFSKAFDRVEHTTAISRLLELGCRPSLTRWICDFLSERRQRVLYQGSLSEWEILT